MMQDLKLERPLVVFDIESTGVVPQRDRIVELAVLKVFPDGHTQNTVRRLNPEMPIPAGATAIHGITNADVADCPTFLLIADKLYRYLEDCDLAGYNITGFDIPMLEAEFKRAGFDFKRERWGKGDVVVPDPGGNFHGVNILPERMPTDDVPRVVIKEKGHFTLKDRKQFPFAAVPVGGKTAFGQHGDGKPVDRLIGGVVQIKVSSAAWGNRRFRQQFRSQGGGDHFHLQNLPRG